MVRVRTRVRRTKELPEEDSPMLDAYREHTKERGQLGIPPLPLNADPASGPSSMPLPHPEQPCKPIETSKQIDPNRPIPNVRLGRPIHPDMDEISTICAQQ